MSFGVLRAKLHRITSCRIQTGAYGSSIISEKLSFDKEGKGNRSLLVSLFLRNKRAFNPLFLFLVLIRLPESYMALLLQKTKMASSFVIRKTPAFLKSCKSFFLKIHLWQNGWWTVLVFISMVLLVLRTWNFFSLLLYSMNPGGTAAHQFIPGQVKIMLNKLVAHALLDVLGKISIPGKSC